MNKLFDLALAAEGVTGSLASLARSIYQQESSGGKNSQTSNAGAVGGMQVLPGTFNGVADKGWDINNPLHNARAGIRYLSQMHKQAGGDPVLAAAGYYGGPGGLEKARRGVAVNDPRNPKAPNTLQYGQQVVARMGKPVAPIQVAKPEPAIPVGVPQGVPVKQAVVQAPIAVAQVPEEWQEFQQQTAPPVQVADLGYGPVVAPQMPEGFFDAPKARKNASVNFNPFAAWKVRI
jgi:hypothetical protein